MLRQPDVRAALGAFYTVKYVAGTEHAQTAEARYGIYGYPTVLVIKPDGTHVRAISSREPGKFIKQLQRASADAR